MPIKLQSKSLSRRSVLRAGAAASATFAAGGLCYSLPSAAPPTGR